MTPLEKLLRRWQAGWARSRDWTDYTDRDGIIRMKIDQPTRTADYLLTAEAPDRLAAVAELARTDEHPPGLSWLTVVAPDAAWTRRQLEREGLEVVRSEWLMTSVLADLQAPTGPVPPDLVPVDLPPANAAADAPADAVAVAVRAATTYRLETESQPGRIDVVVRASGRQAIASSAPDAVAASGRMMVLGADAIADVIATDPDHRRRGLGRAVMSALTAAAVGQGATDGLLVASEDGRQLYRALGWSTASEIVIARSR